MSEIKQLQVDSRKRERIVCVFEWPKLFFFHRLKISIYLCTARRYYGFPWWLRQKRICLQCRRSGFDPWVRKIPWRRECMYSSMFAWRVPRTEETGGLQPLLLLLNIQEKNIVFPITIKSKKYIFIYLVLFYF